jgi:glycosyltransferase involved in cell wall biosynthesis
MKAESRPRVLLYSDCSFFAGCENMPANILNDPGLAREFELLFAYRYSAKYAAGLAGRVNSGVKTIPLRIPAVETLLEALDRRGLTIVSRALRVTGLISALKYVFALYASVVLFFLMKEVRPDILHINNGGYPGAYSCISAVFAAGAAGVKRVVFVVNNVAVPYTRFTRRLEWGIDRLVVRNVSVFITGSGYAGDRLRSLLELPPEKVLNIPNGIASRPVKETREAVLKRLGIPDNALVLGTVAVLEPRKGHKYLLEALAQVRDKFDGFSKVVLLIEGLGGERARLEELVAGLGLKENVRFLGREANVFDLMRAFDVFILPSVGYEDFPNVILEAMSMGKPVVGTKVAGIPEQVLDGETGLIVEPADAGALAGAVLRLLSDSQARAEMGRKGRERFDARFICGKAVAGYAALYRGLAVRSVN